MNAKMENILEHNLLKNRKENIRRTLTIFEENNLNPDNFCLMPFVNIILEPTGSIGLCRHKGTEFSLGNIKDNTISEIWNGEFAKRWRKEFLEGKPKICEVEFKHRKCHLCPELNKMIPQAQIKELPEKFIRLTANFNGKCNLECQMCHIWKMPNSLYDDLNFWEPAKKDIFPYVKEIDMLSGEPFIQKDTYRLIDEVTETNPDCLWTITTNCHWKLNQRIKEKLDKIKVKNLILSVDSFNKDTYAKIRKKGNLEFVLENIERLKEYESERIDKGMTPLTMNLHFLVQKDNWMEVKYAIDYCLEQDIQPFISYCYHPTEHSVDTLSQKEKTEILDFYIHQLTWDYITQITRIINPILDGLKPIEKIKYLDLLKVKKEDFESE